MIWVVAGEAEAGRESSLILHTWLLSPLATTLPFCCKRTVATRLTVDDSRTVSSERHSVAFVAFCVILLVLVPGFLLHMYLTHIK